MLPSIDALAKIRWDTPYRLVASTSFLLAVAAWFSRRLARPSDAFRVTAKWLGADLSKYTEAIAAWFQARQEFLSTSLLLLILLGVLALTLGSRFRQPRSRSSATILLCFALLAEANGTPQWKTEVLILVGVLAFSLTFLSGASLKGYDFVWTAMVMTDVIAHALYAVLMPLSWLFGEPVEPSEDADARDEASSDAQGIVVPAERVEVRSRPDNDLEIEDASQR